MTDRELMQMALNTLDLVTDLTSYDDEVYEAIDALRARLAQPVVNQQLTTEPPCKTSSQCIGGKCERCIQPAQPEQEPVAWLYKGDDVYGKDVCLNEDIFEEQKPNCIPLYTAPPQREWQGLTDEEILEEYRQSYGDDGNLTDVYFARAIEAKLKEKNTQ